MQLYAHPFSSYCQKALIALYENDTPFEYRVLAHDAQRMDAREWAAGDSFSLADCAAAPALFYADWTHPIAAGFVHVHAYRRRLLARPSFARAVDEARPYRRLFPLGAPDRD